MKYLKEKEVAIVIPVYKNEPSETEILSYRQCTNVLGNNDIVIVTSPEVNLSAYLEIYPDFKVEYFDSSYFQSIEGYNKLMLSKMFYSRFVDYKYILVHQLDAFVFKDDLKKWTKKSYDYIGAPWMKFSIQLFFSVLLHVSIREAIKVFTKKMLRKPVGNGGFSLRKVSASIEAIDENQKLLSKWNANEDYFWSYYATNNGRSLKKPSKEEAINFAIETSPKKAFRYLKSNLPFGVHAWETYDSDFWKMIIQEHCNTEVWPFVKKTA
jgi:hypothetical protein